jgi:hypothetical protein
MSKQTAIEWLSNQSYELFEQYSEGNFDRITLNKLMLKLTEQANKMFEEQQYDFYMKGNFEGRGNYEEATKKNFELEYKKTYDK